MKNCSNLIIRNSVPITTPIINDLTLSDDIKLYNSSLQKSNSFNFEKHPVKQFLELINTNNSIKASKKKSNKTAEKLKKRDKNFKMAYSIKTTMDQENIITTGLNQHFMFMNFTKKSLEEIIDYMNIFNYNDEEIIFGKGEVANNFYIIKKGVVLLMSDGKIYKKLTTGDTFGEIALFQNESIIKNIDVDDLQDVFGKNFQDQRTYEEGQKLMKEMIINDSPEIKEIKDAIEHAKLNQILARQMNQNMLLRKQKLMKEAEEEELVLKEIENEKRRKREEEEKKKIEFLKNREINLQQIRDRKLLQEQAEKEYERDKKLVDDMIKKMQEEDLAAKKEEQRKRDINKMFMQNAFKERDLLKQKEAENDKKQDEDIRKYHEEVARREQNIIQKKNDLQQQKDKIFNKLCDEEAKRKAEQDYWDNIRADLHVEQDLYKAKKF